MKAKYSEARLKLILEEYISNLDFITSIKWQDVVAWAKKEYPHEMRNLSYEYFSRSHELRSIRDTYNSRLEGFSTDKDSVDAIIQDYSIDWRILAHMSEVEQQEYFTEHNRKISKLIESQRKLQLRIETMKRSREADRKTIQKLTTELDEERNAGKAHGTENKQIKTKIKQMRETIQKMQEFIEDHVNTPIVQQHLQELGIIPPAIPNGIMQQRFSESDDNDDSGEIITAKEASILERLEGIKS